MRYISYYSYTIVSKFVAHIKKTYSTKLRSRLILFFLLLLLKSQHVQNPVEKNSSSLLSKVSLCLFFPVVSVALSLSLLFLLYYKQRIRYHPPPPLSAKTM